MNSRYYLITLSCLIITLFWSSNIFGINSPYDLFVKSGSTLRSNDLEEISFFANKQAVVRFSEVELNSVATQRGLISKGDILVLNLFEDRSLTAKVDRLDTNINGTFSIRARITEYPMGFTIISTTGNMSLGIVTIPETDEEYQIVSSPESNTCYVMDIDREKKDYFEPGLALKPQATQKEDLLKQKRIAKVIEAKRDGDDGVGPLDPATIGIMIVYTNEARKYASNSGGIDNLIANAMESGQLALDNSDMNITIELVHSAQVTYKESGNPYADLYRLTASPTYNPWGDAWTYSGKDYDIPGYLDEVHEWRREYGADVVGFFASFSSVGGLGWLLMDINGMPNYAFNIDRVEQIIGTYTFIHEVGHNVGLHHSAEQNYQPGPTIWDNWEENTWSAGWRWTSPGGDRRVSVMSYEEGQYYNDKLGGKRVPYFSSPLLKDGNVPMGHPQLADNVRTLKEVKHVIAAYSESVALEGVVYESDTQIPVKDALIEIDGIDYTMTTDDEGYFCFISLMEEPTTIKFSRIGFYDKVVEDVDIKVGLPTSIEIYMDKHPNITFSGRIIGSDNLDVGLSNVEITLEGYDNFATSTAFTGEFAIPGVFTGHKYRLTITAEGYDVYSERIEIEENSGNVDMGTICLTEISYPAYQVVCEEKEDYSLQLNWNDPIKKYDDFRYDSGEVGDSFGIPSGSLYSVFGTAFPLESQINEISWYLTSKNDTHDQVKIILFGLDEEGKPIASNILFEKENVKNFDDEWNTYKFPYAINAPHGFLVGVCYKGNISIALDEPNEEKPFVPNVNYINLDYRSSIWRDVSSAGFPKNYLIRAKGYDLSKAVDLDETINRELSGFNVYKFSVGEEENIDTWSHIAYTTESTYTDDNWKKVDSGDYRFGIIAEYVNEVHSIASLSGTLSHTKMMPNAPKELVYTILDYGQIQLSWKPDETEEVEGYNVYRNDEKVNDELIRGLSFIDTITEGESSFMYYVTAVKGVEESEPSNFVEVIVTGIELSGELPSVTKLGNNYPNPFNPETTINYSLKDNAVVKLEVFDIKGHMIKKLVDGRQNAGVYSVIWNGVDEKGHQVSSGIYFYRITADSYRATKKMILMK